MVEHRRAQEWIVKLDLQVLEGESGWWTDVHRSTVKVVAGDDVLPACNSIFYLLEPSRPINKWHHLLSDDTHVLIDGGPVEYVVVDDAGTVTRQLLSAASPMITVPANSFKALRLVDPTGFALMGSVVAPAWSPDRVRIEPPQLTQRPTWLTDDLMLALTTGVLTRPPIPGRAT